MSEFVEQLHPDVRDDERMAVIGALLELAGHKTPRMRVLELGGDAQGYKAKQWLSMLGKDTAFSRCQSWHTGELTEEGDISITDDEKGPFKVIVVPRVSISTLYHLVRGILDEVAELLISPFMSARYLDIRPRLR